MTASGPPEPHGTHDPRRLSLREEAILARIENDLVSDAPALTRLGASRSSVPGLMSPVSTRDLALLVVILLVLVGAAILVPPAQVWVGLPALTVLLVVPWTVLCVRRPTADR